MDLGFNFDWLEFLRLDELSNNLYKLDELSESLHSKISSISNFSHLFLF